MTDEQRSRRGNRRVTSGDRPPVSREPVDEHGPPHPDRAAELRERADGAHSEQIGQEANLRADPEPPDPPQE